MSSQPSGTKDSSKQSSHSEDCAAEAAQLLNCVTSKKYNKEQCIVLLESLRRCVRKQGVIDFTLLPDQESTPEESSKQ